ncbi:unnamed protein product [Wickerhamomyces anomalus]
MSSVSDENQTVTKPVSAFRQSVGSMTKKSKWVSPFRQQANAEANVSTTEKHEKSDSLDTSAPASKKQKVDAEKKVVDRTINPKDLEKRLGELSTTAEASANKKIKPEDRIVDLGGGLKMSQAAIDKIARERLGKDLQQIDERASSQQKLRELKHQKKLELQALKDQNKVNSKFAKFKKKLDLEKKSITSEHDRKVKEIESSIASLDKQIKDFDKKTNKEIKQSIEDAETQTKTADEKLVDDKQKTTKEAADLEKEHLQTIHDHQISQKRSEITTRVLHAKQSEYELELELLELKLAQSNRELAKQQEHNTSHSGIKEDLEAQIATTKQAISENNAKIEQSENLQLESAKSLKSAEGELESSRKAVESLKVQLAELKAGKDDREARLQEAISKRKVYDEEQEQLRKEAEEKARIAEEERLRKEEEEKQRKAEEEERLRIEEEERKRQEEEQKRLDEEERQRKLEEEERIRKEKEEQLRKEKEEKKKKHDLAAVSFGSDLDARKSALDKKISEKKASDASVDEITLLELERKHLDGWTYENQDSKARELGSSLAVTKKDQQAKAKIAEKEAKKKAAAAEKEEKKRAAAAAKEEKKKKAAAEKEERKNKKSSTIGAVAVPAAVITGTGAAVGAGAGAVGSGASKGVSGASNAVSTIGSKPSNDLQTKSVEPASSTSKAVSKDDTAVPTATSNKPASKSTAPVARERSSSPKDSDRKSRRSSLFGFFKKKSRDESESPEREDKKKGHGGALGAATATTAGAGIVGAGVASESATKLASNAPGGPVATVPETSSKNVETSDVPPASELRDVEPQGVVGSTDAIKDEVPKQTADEQISAQPPTADKDVQAEPIAIASTTDAEPVAAEKTTELADDYQTPVPATQPVSTANDSIPKEGISAGLKDDKQEKGSHAFAGPEIENVTGSEFQTSVIQDGEDPILAIKAADPNISLEEITLEQAKHEDNVLAVVAGHDSTLQEIEKSELYHAQTSAPQSKASDIVFDRSKAPDTAPTTAGDDYARVPESKGGAAAHAGKYEEVPADVAAGITAATGAAGAGYALGHDVSKEEAPIQEQIPQKYQDDAKSTRGLVNSTEEDVRSSSKVPTEVPTEVAAGIAAATGAAGAGYALGLSKAQEVEQPSTPLNSEVEPEKGSVIEPAPTKKDTVGESANETAPLTAAIAVPENTSTGIDALDKGAETTKTPLNESSYVEPATISASKEQKLATDHSTPVAVGGATGFKPTIGKSKDEAPLNKGEYVEPEPVSIPDDQKFKVVGGDHIAPKSNDIVEQPSTSKDFIGAAVGATTAGVLGGAAISSKDTADKDIPKSVEPLVDSSSAPKVVRASEPHTLPAVSHEQLATGHNEQFQTLDPGAPAEIQDLSTDDYTTSREATPEPGAALATVASPTTKGKNAKKNKKKREAAKKKKAAAAGNGARELESSPEPESAPIDTTTAGKDESTLDTIGGTVAGALAGTAAAVGLTSGSEKDELKDSGVVSVLSKEVSKVDAKPSTYEEPKPVEIPSEQKFSVVPNVSKTSNGEKEPIPSTSEAGSSEGPGILETAAIAATGAALTGAAVFESTKDKVVNAVSGEADEDKTTDVTLKDSNAADNLKQNKDGLAEEVDAGYYSLDPKRASNRFSQTDSAAEPTSSATAKPDVDTSKHGESSLLGKGTAAGVTGAAVVGGATAATANGKTPSQKDLESESKAKSTTTTPKKPVANAKQQPKEEPKKRFGIKRFWKSDKKDLKDEVKPVAATATPVKKSTKATTSAAEKPTVSTNKPATAATAASIPNKDTKSSASSKPVEKTKDAELKEADVSEIKPSLAATGAVTTGVVGGTAAGASDPKSTEAAAATKKEFGVKNDNDSLYSYREVYVYEDVTDDEDEGLITKAVNTATKLSSTII